MLVLHYVFAVVFILSVRVSSSYVSRETAEVGMAICKKPAEARNEAWEPPWTIHYQTTAWYRVTKYLESLRVVRWHDTATMYGAKNKSCINGERSNYRRTTSCLDRCTVWRLYFAGLNFRELLFENISLKKFREFTVKRHAHTMGVVYYTHRYLILHLKTSVHAELN